MMCFSLKCFFPQKYLAHRQTYKNGYTDNSKFLMPCFVHANAGKKYDEHDCMYIYIYILHLPISKRGDD